MPQLSLPDLAVTAKCKHVGCNLLLTSMTALMHHCTAVVAVTFALNAACYIC